MKNKLTIEESQKLIALGVDAELASWREFVDKPEEDSNQFLEIEEYPRFTLTDILSILPKEIDSYHLNISAGKIEWYVSYENIGINNTMLVKWDAAASELIDALNQLAIYCLENNHIKIEKI